MTDLSELTHVWLKKCLPRDVTACECPECQGYAQETTDIVEPVKKNAIANDCGRSRFRMCCTKAFKCKRCSTVILTHLEAPEFN